MNHLRLGLHFDWFRSSDFLVGGDTNTRVDGILLVWLHAAGERRQHLRRDAHLEQPQRALGRRRRAAPRSGAHQVLRKIVLGAKGALPVATGQSVAFLLGLRFLSSISDLSISPSSTSLWFGPLYTVDLRPIYDVPLRFHASVDYYLDNSDNLINFSDPANASVTKFSREVATFAYGIAKSRLRFAVGADMPLEQLTAPVPLDLLAEYHADVVTASGDAVFKGLSPANRDQQWVTLGVRARVFHGLTLDAGADIRVRSVGYEYGPPLPPYLILFGASFPLDIDAFTKPVIVTKTVERPVSAGPPPALEAQISWAQ